MKCVRHLSFSVAFLGAALLAAPCAQADPPGQPPSAANQGRAESNMQHQGEEHMQRLAGVIHDALALRSDQEASWRTFMTSMAPSDGMMMQHHSDEMQNQSMTMTTPQMLDQMAARMSREQAEFARHAAAVRQFYAVLSPTQQRTFDALAMLMHHSMNMHGMRGMGMHHEDDDSMMH